MGLFVFGIFVTVLLFVLLGITTEKYSVNGSVKQKLTWKMSKKQLLALLGVVIIAVSCATSVPTGHTGIITTFGKVEDYTFEAGVHFKAPWQDVVKMDNRNQKGSLQLACFSSDIQEVELLYSINYQIRKADAQEIYRNIGENYYETVMTPRIQEAVKSVIARYTADELVESRNDLSKEIQNILTEDLATYSIEVISTAVENIDFADAFTDAVEAKQVAAQNKLQAEIEQEQATMEQQQAAERAVISAEADAKTAQIKAQAEAEVRKINAEAEAEAKKIQADADEYAGEKQAEVNKKLQESMNEDLLKYYFINGWNGTLPETYVSDGNFLSLLDIQPAKDAE